jgi:hypothetical protein
MEKPTIIVHTLKPSTIPSLVIKHGAQVTELMPNHSIETNCVFSRLVLVLAFVHALVAQLFSSKAATPIGTATVADLRIK